MSQVAAKVQEGKLSFELLIMSTKQFILELPLNLKQL